MKTFTPSSSWKRNRPGAARRAPASRRLRCAAIAVPVVGCALALFGQTPVPAAPPVFNAQFNWPADGQSANARVNRSTPFVEVALPCPRRDVERLVADTSVPRIYRTGTRAVPRTRFTMGLNNDGWGVQVECSEPDAVRLNDPQKAQGEKVEILFAPGAQGPAYHLVADLASRSLAEVRLVESGPGPRALTTGAWISGDEGADRFLKSSVVVLPAEWRVAFTLPFALFESSPPAAPAAWRFNVIRWLPDSTAGAVTWCGQAGNPASWGEIAWPPVDEPRQATVRKRTVENAWSQYQADTVEAMIHWQWRGIDPTFYAAALLPIITNNYPYETNVGVFHARKLVSLAPRKEQVDDPENPLALEDPVDQARSLIDTLYARVPGWIDFPGRCDRLRRDYLLDQLCEPALPAQTPGRDASARYFAVPPFSAVPLLPDAPPAHGRLTASVRLVATPGEYEPASFVIQAAGDVARLTFRLNALKDGDHALATDCLDLRVVKCWYQGASAWQGGLGGAGVRVLIPELLLKDDALVRTDPDRKTNLLRTEQGYCDLAAAVPAGPEQLIVADASTLQPVAIRHGESRQFWLTVGIPAGQAPGLYRGDLEVFADGRAWTPLQVAVRVLPFQLPPPGCYGDATADYITSLAGGGELRKASASPRSRSEAQLLAEFRNRLAHNERHPLFTDPACTAEEFRTLVRLRQSAGLPVQPVLGLGSAAGAQAGDPQAVKRFVEAKVQPLLQLVEAVCGHRELYFIGQPDATGEALKQQRSGWEGVLDAGGRVMASGWGENLPAMGDLQDLHVRHGEPSRMEALTWHRLGGRIVQGGDPFGGLENPERSRRNFGMLAYQAHYDGCVGESYWDERPWDDFDGRRPRNMVYPTYDGVIDTLAWEGFREGIDDVRYATLLKTLALACMEKGGPQARDRAKEALHALELMDARSIDLDALRLEMIQAILALRGI